jgi:hypothetical protein
MVSVLAAGLSRAQVGTRLGEGTGAKLSADSTLSGISVNVYRRTEGLSFLWSCVMPRSPSIVPEDTRRDVYLVLDDFGSLGRAVV